MLQTSLGDLLVVVSFSSHLVISVEKEISLFCVVLLCMIFVFLVWELMSFVTPRKIIIQYEVYWLAVADTQYKLLTD